MTIEELLQVLSAVEERGLIPYVLEYNGDESTIQSLTLTVRKGGEIDSVRLDLR